MKIIFEAFKEAQKLPRKIPEIAAQTRPGRGPDAAQVHPGHAPARGQAAPQRVARSRPRAPGGPSSGFDPERARRFPKPS